MLGHSGVHGSCVPLGQVMDGGWVTWPQGTIETVIAIKLSVLISTWDCLVVSCLMKIPLKTSSHIFYHDISSNLQAMSTETF